MKKFNTLIENLISEFSYELVFSQNDEKINLKLQDIKNIYNIINKCIFNSKLIMPKIIINESFSNTNRIAGYNYNIILLKNENKYTLVSKKINLKSGKILLPPRILLNPDLMNIKIPLMFFVNILTHEMIHQDDIENGNLLERMYISNKKHIPFNSHNGYFENFANFINNAFNLDVKEAGKTMEIEMNNSVETVRKALLEKFCKFSTDVILEKDLNLTDAEKLKLILKGIKKSKDMKITYVGNGAFDVTMF